MPGYAEWKHQKQNSDLRSEGLQEIKKRSPIKQRAAAPLNKELELSLDKGEPSIGAIEFTQKKQLAEGMKRLAEGAKRMHENAKNMQQQQKGRGDRKQPALSR